MSRADPDTPQFEQIFAENVDYVWRVLGHLGVPARDRDDLVQEVFLVVHRKLSDYEPRASVRSWLWAIAWRVMMASARKARRAPIAVGFEPQPVSEEPTPERTAADRQALRRLDEAVAALSPAQRAIFLMHEVEGMPMRAIVEGMGCPLQTGYSRLRLARAKVREAFTEAPDA